MSFLEARLKIYLICIQSFWFHVFFVLLQTRNIFARIRICLFQKFDYKNAVQEFSQVTLFERKQI